MRKDANNGKLQPPKVDVIEAYKQKLLNPKAVKEETKDHLNSEDGEVDEPHMIPESAVIKNLKDLRSD